MDLNNVDKAEVLISKLRDLEEFIDTQRNYDAYINITGISNHNNNSGSSKKATFPCTDKQLTESIVKAVNNEIESIKKQLSRL